MFIFDTIGALNEAVDLFDGSIGLSANVSQWVSYKGMPEACRNAFFEGKIGSYLVPEEVGGGAYSLFERAVCMAQLTRRAGSVLPILSEVTDYALLAGLEQFVEDDSRNRELLPMKGLRPEFSEAFTEPSFFDGVEELTTRVGRSESGRLVLSGHKTFVPNGEFEDSVLILAKDEVLGSQDGGVSLWMVPLGLPGISASPISVIGQSMLAPADVSFDNVELDESWRLDTQGKLSVVLRRQYELRCLFMAAVDVGLARAAFDDAQEFVWGDALAAASLQCRSQMKADLYDIEVDVQAMELFVRHAANVLDAQNSRDSYFACKSLMHFVPKTSLQACEKAMGLFGLRGYSEDVRIGRILNDCRGNYLRQSGEQIMLSVLRSMFAR